MKEQKNSLYPLPVSLTIERENIEKDIEQAKHFIKTMFPHVPELTWMLFLNQQSALDALPQAILRKAFRGEL